MKPKSEKKLVVLLLNGWSLKPHFFANLFHQSYHPYFHNLWQQNRSLLLVHDYDNYPTNSFYTGQLIPTKTSAINKQLLEKGFWQNPQILKITDRLQRSGGRLWFFIPRYEHFLPKTIDTIPRATLKKFGFFNLDPHFQFSNPFVSQNDWQIVSPQQANSQLKINPEDIIIIFGDNQDYQYFHPNLAKQQYLPLDIYTLTDKENRKYFETIVTKPKVIDFRDLIVNANLKFAHKKFNPQYYQDDLPKTDLTIIDLPNQFFLGKNKFENYKACRHFLVDLTFRGQHDLMITSFHGPFQSKMEILPFIFIQSYSTFHQPKGSILEEYLNSSYSLADIAPTILDYFGLKSHSLIQGQNLFPHLFPEKYLGEHLPLERRQPEPSMGSLF